MSTAAVTSIREIPHLCSCDWDGPDYRVPPQDRRYTLRQASRSCGYHGSRAPVRVPAAAPLGVVMQAALAAVAREPAGLTITGLAAAAGWKRWKAEQAARPLRDRGLLRVAGHQRRAGKAAAVYVITTAGSAVLEAAREAA